MRSGIQVARHNNIVCFYGNKKRYMELLGIKDLKTAYAFLLDNNRNVLVKFAGAPNPQSQENIESHL